MHDRIDLVALQGRATAQGQHHRGAGQFALAGEGAGLGNGQVHACILHRAQRGDGTHQLGFQRVLVAGVFHELADAKARVALDHLKAQPAIVGGTGTSQLEPGIVQALRGDVDRAGGRVQLERDLCRAQQVGRLGRGLGVGAGIQRDHLLFLRPEKHRQADRHRGGDHGHHPQLAGDLHALDFFKQGRGFFRLVGFFAGERFVRERDCHRPGFLTAACSSRPGRPGRDGCGFPQWP